MYGAIIPTAPKSYSHFESQSRSKVNRVCIDGKVTGCGKCVGYCQYSGHPGFLTAQHRKEHNCIGKGCFYYVARPARQNHTEESTGDVAWFLSEVKRKTAAQEGLKVMDVFCTDKQNWTVRYITISNAYAINTIAEKLSQELECMVRFEKLNYSFENCVRLIMGG